MLHIARGLSLPIEAVTQTFAILAMRGVGKTYTASVLAEEFSKSGLPYAVLDPTGAWFGLRASSDGKGPGYPVTILGGDHGDVPLEEAAGKVIAALLADEAPQLVLDLSLFTKSAMRRFVADFAEELYRKNRNPLHLIMDEADAFCPQKPRPDEMRMLGAIDEIVRRGRIHGLGCTLVTQRSAVLNKDVLTQMEVLVALRTAHPRDRAPVLEWMKVHATQEQLAQVTETLATLPKGDAWIMSAGWLDLFKRVHVRERETFNSSATPEPGQRQIEPKKLADVDLKVLRERMAATIERAKAEDPRELRRQIAALKAEFAKKPVPFEPKTIKVPTVPATVVQRVEQALARMDKIGLRLTAEVQRLIDLHADVRARQAELRAALAAAVKQAAVPMLTHAPQRPVPPRIHVVKDGINPDARMAPGEKKILTACAQYPRGATREQLTVLTGYKRSSRDTYLQRLQARGFIEIGSSITATTEGIAALGDDHEPLPTGNELREYWLQRLQGGERRIFEQLVQAYPAAIARESLEESTGLKRSSRDTYIQRLRSRQLVEVLGHEGLRASEELFE